MIGDARDGGLLARYTAVMAPRTSRLGGSARSLPIAALAAAAAAGLLACHRASPEASAGDAAVGVTVQAARTDTLRDVATAAGVVVPSTAADLTIYAPESGTIAELPKQENETVQTGDVLVRFDLPTVTTEVTARELTVAEAQARADAAKTAFTRQSDLFNRGIIPRNAYEAARDEQAAAASALAEATTQLDLAKTEGGRGIVRAHFPGKVIHVWHKAGDQVVGGQTDPVLRVIDPTRVQVAAELPVAQLARIVPGQAATVHAFDTNAPLSATVVSKPAATDPSAPTGSVRLAFDAPSTLAVDAPVSVEIVLDQRTGVLVVPTAAVLGDNDSSYVVVAGDDRRAHRRNVRTGLSTKTMTQIASGLSPGERVIVTGLDDLSEGTPITYAP